MKYFLVYEEHTGFCTVDGIWKKNWTQVDTLIQAQRGLSIFRNIPYMRNIVLVVEVVLP
jgi:hypothetical protein